MTVKPRLGIWLVLVALMTSLPGGASGRFVCLLGMAEAGPACPACHGDLGDNPTSPHLNNRCCEFRAGERPSAIVRSGVKVEKPAATYDNLASPFWCAEICAPQESARAKAPAHLLADLSPPASFLGNFLRL